MNLLDPSSPILYPSSFHHPFSSPIPAMMGHVPKSSTSVAVPSPIYLHSIRVPSWRSPAPCPCPCPLTTTAFVLSIPSIGAGPVVACWGSTCLLYHTNSHGNICCCSCLGASPPISFFSFNLSSSLLLSLQFLLRAVALLYYCVKIEEGRLDLFSFLFIFLFYFQFIFLFFYF